MSVQIFGILYLLGGVQALLLVIALSKKSEAGKNARTFLIWLLISIATVLFQYALTFNKVWPKADPYLYRLGLTAWYAIPPILLLYSQKIIQPHKRLKWQDLIYFLVPIFTLVQTILGFFTWHIPIYSFFDDLNNYTIACLLGYLLNALFFTSWSYILLIKSSFSRKWFKRLKIYRLFLLTFNVLLVAGIAIAIISWDSELFFWQFEHLLLLSFATFVLVLAYHSIRYSPYVNSLHQDVYGVQRKNALDLKQLYVKLDASMRAEKLYLNRKLDLATLSEATQIPMNTLSQIFTQYLGMHFYSFVNQYRLEEWNQLMQDPANQSFTIAAVAENAGFRSKASFYKAFKEKFGMTPTQYLSVNRA